MSKRTIEIRAAEGGDDARIFVAQLSKAYLSLANKFGWKAHASSPLDTRTGHQYIAIELDGDGVDKIENEIGGHRLQRVPPTERNGRVHSSSVTVSVMGGQTISKTIYDQRSESDFEISWYSGSGAGGQFRNKHLNSARIVHLPSGIVRQAQTRSRQNSQKSAMRAIHEDFEYDWQSQ